jgi:serine/threonine-protein kinase
MSDLIGKTISNRYRVDSLLGRGGMGDVYKVWDSQRGVFLAMKVLHADLAEDKVFLRRFAREAETLSALQHPHIVRFYGLEQEGRLTFMLMDYVEGTTLRGQIFDSSQPFTVEQVLQIVKPVCSALHYAHQMGRVHCDIKPANIMVKSNGDVLVADFGIARMMENSTTTTMAGAGTPAYMAPEQVLGKNPVPQTDIYALGIVLYEMLTGGERPFTGEQAQTDGSTSEKVRWEQITLQPPSLRKYNPDISPQLEAVVSKCLQKKPEDRYADAFSLLNALSAAVKGESLKLSDVKQPAIISLPAKQSEVLKRAVAKKEVGRFAPRKTQLALFAWVIGGVLVIVLSFLFLRLNINVTPFAPTVAPIVIDVPVETEASVTTEVPTVTEALAATESPLATELPTLSIGSTTIGKDGATLVYVPSGSFMMGSADTDSLAYPGEKPQHPVTLDAFWIDQTEVTNKQYAACISDGGCTPLSATSSSTRTTYYGTVQFDGFPVIYVDWNQANAYCLWAGRELPSEAQWEKAARGTDARIYPWGNDAPNDIFLNYNQNIGDTTRVGSYEKGKSFYGAYDMAGNAWEWVNDWYDVYPGGDASASRYFGQKYRVLRGGSWDLDSNLVRSAARVGSIPSETSGDSGFRCAISLPLAAIEAPVVPESPTMTEAPITTETLSPTISPESICSSPIEWEAQNILLGGPPTRIGRPDENGWSANTGQDQLGYLQYGPYITDVDVGNHIVTWALMIDDNSYDNLPIVRLEVSDYTTGVTILASRDITRREWSKTFEHECFYLPFSLDSSRLGHILEFRILWYGIAYVHLTKVGLK